MVNPLDSEKTSDTEESDEVAIDQVPLKFNEPQSDMI